MNADSGIMFLGGRYVYAMFPFLESFENELWEPFLISYILIPYELGTISILCVIHDI